MALVTFSGFPASGKSTRAQQLAAHLNACIALPQYTGPLKNVLLLSDHSLNISRTAYNDPASEKPARAALFTAIQRHLAPHTVLLVDAPNYIKGFRYQMYCAAREAKVRVCTVNRTLSSSVLPTLLIKIYVLAQQDQCRQWNSARPSGEQYSLETLENLFLRYEEPSSMVRWDTPLFTVLWSDNDVPASDIWSALTSGDVKPPNSGSLATAKAPTDALLTLEKTASTIVSEILSNQSFGSGNLTLEISPDVRVKMSLPARTLTLSELQRLKRQFVTVHKKAITLGTIEKGTVDWDERSISSKFVVYLEENLS